MTTTPRTFETTVPVQFGGAEIDVPLQVQYAFSPPLPATRDDQASGGIEIFDVQANLNGSWETLTKYRDEDWFQGDILVALYEQCGVAPEDMP